MMEGLTPVMPRKFVRNIEVMARILSRAITQHAVVAPKLRGFVTKDSLGRTVLGNRSWFTVQDVLLVISLAIVVVVMMEMENVSFFPNCCRTKSDV
jgi:ABC-type antimicrobial peptide transport system permease subunit